MELPGSESASPSQVGKKSLPSVSNQNGSSMSLPFGLTWWHLLIIVVVLYVVWKYVLKK